MVLLFKKAYHMHKHTEEKKNSCWSLPTTEISKSFTTALKDEGHVLLWTREDFNLRSGKYLASHLKKKKKISHSIIRSSWQESCVLKQTQLPKTNLQQMQIFIRILHLTGIIAAWQSAISRQLHSTDRSHPPSWLCGSACPWCDPGLSPGPKMGLHDCKL